LHATINPIVTSKRAQLLATMSPLSEADRIVRRTILVGIACFPGFFLAHD